PPQAAPPRPDAPVAAQPLGRDAPGRPDPQGSPAGPPAAGRVEPPAAPPQPQQPAAVASPARPPLRPESRRFETFRDCEQCPAMVRLPAGSFTMGSAGGADDASEKPARQVTVAAFALGRFPLTVAEWKLCFAAAACSYEASGADDAPVHNLSWNDAQQYVEWLSKVSQQKYRLPTEAEWEYAARAETTTKFWWGDQPAASKANCKGCGEPYDANQPLRVGSFAANPFGLFDMAGGVAQWVSDCWHRNYQGAPNNGGSWDAPNCRTRVLRGGSWRREPKDVRPARR